MNPDPKSPDPGLNISKWQIFKLLTVFAIAGILICSPTFISKSQKVEVKEANFEERLTTIQDNSLLAMANPINPEPRVAKEIRVIVTAYSSTPWETDGNPFVTASGKWVKDGIIANNLLPFGTKVRLPEIYGDRVFVVEDRMNRKKGYYHVDIWFASHSEAKNFGAKRTYLEILEG